MAMRQDERIHLADIILQALGPKFGRGIHLHMMSLNDDMDTGPSPPVTWFGQIQPRVIMGGQGTALRSAAAHDEDFHPFKKRANRSESKSCLTESSQSRDLGHPYAHPYLYYSSPRPSPSPALTLLAFPLRLGSAPTPVFANLTDKLSKALRDLRGLSKLSEENIAPALTEVRSALMSADVNFKVAKDFTERVKVACLGQAVIEAVNPGQMAVKIVSDELTKLLGEGECPLNPRRPLRVLLVGLQGSGKTTSAAKLAKHLVKKEGIRKPSLIAADLRRPAAIDQLETLAKNEGFDFRADRAATDVAAMVGRLVKEAEAAAADLVIVDTAGRLQIDSELMDEVRRVREAFAPHEIFLVADAALGQQAVDVAAKFNETTPLTGIILTKLDGDARGGAALSMKSVTGVPIRYLGTGEKSGDFDTFHPDRMAQRILGMGDVVSLVEKAQEVVDHKEAERLAEKMKKADFDLEDFLSQMSQMKKMGPLGDIMKMLPGMGNVQVGAKEEKQLSKTEAIILSMTKKERRNPDVLNGSRRLRIAKGSGTQVSDVNALIKQFSQMRDMMRMMKGGKGKELMRRMGQMGGGGPPGGRGGFPGGGFPGMR